MIPDHCFEISTARSLAHLALSLVLTAIPVALAVAFLPLTWAWAPAWVLYASGFANRYGFPSARVRERVAAAGVRELNTAEAGAIGFVLTTTGLAGPELYREAEPRLWSWRPRGER